MVGFNTTFCDANNFAQHTQNTNCSINVHHILVNIPLLITIIILTFPININVLSSSCHSCWLHWRIILIAVKYEIKPSPPSDGAVLSNILCNLLWKKLFLMNGENKFLFLLPCEHSAVVCTIPQCFRHFGILIGRPIVPIVPMVPIAYSAAEKNVFFRALPEWGGGEAPARIKKT